MLKSISITSEEILHQLKISLKIPEVVQAIVIRKIIEETVKEFNLKVETEHLQEAADQFRLINNLEKTENTLEWLDQHGLSVDDFEAMVSYSFISSKLIGHLFGGKAEPWFFEHQLDYASAIVYEIILDDEDLAVELFYAIKEKELNFYEVAHQYIKDIELQRRGGYLGKVSRKQMKPEISAAVFAANPPELLKPIFTSRGIHLILVEEIIQPQLDDQLRYQIGQELFSDWLQQQIQQVTVNIQLNESTDSSVRD